MVPGGHNEVNGLVSGGKKQAEKEGRDGRKDKRLTRTANDLLWTSRLVRIYVPSVTTHLRMLASPFIQQLSQYFGMCLAIRQPFFDANHSPISNLVTDALALRSRWWKGLQRPSTGPILKVLVAVELCLDNLAQRRMLVPDICTILTGRKWHSFCMILKGREMAFNW